MKDATKLYELIEALRILDLVTDKASPYCEHELFVVGGVKKNEVTPGDLVRLEAYGFVWSDEHEAFISPRHGGCEFNQ